MYKLIANQIDYLTEDEAFNHLAKGIVIQAIEDYREVLKHNRIKYVSNKRYNQTELEKFFLSDWFQALCDWDGETLITIIKEQEGVTNERTDQRTLL